MNAHRPRPGQRRRRGHGIEALGPAGVHRGYVHSMAFSVVGGSVQPLGKTP